MDKKEWEFKYGMQGKCRGGISLHGQFGIQEFIYVALGSFFSMFNRLTKPLCVHVIVFLSHINVVSVLVVVAMVSV